VYSEKLAWALSQIASGGKLPVSNADDYQRLAAECLRLAQSATAQTNKLSLLQMAQNWLKLAERELMAPGRQTDD